MDEDSAAIEVIQSPDSTIRYTAIVEEREASLVFVSAAKGRMDFSIALDGTPHGKFNLLSQHSIQRLLKAAGIPLDEQKDSATGFLTVGELLRDGNYTPAPAPTAATPTYTGKASSFGPIDDTVIGDFLTSLDLLDRVNDILHHSRLIPFRGDDAGLVMNFLVILSCKSGTPLNLELIGPSAAGKTHLALTARNGFPKNMVMVLAGASREALKYDYDEVDGQGNYLVHVGGKCIIVLEKDESSAFVQRLKPLMSGDDDELVFKTPIKNEVTGEIETRDFKIIGQPSFVTLTTRNPKEWEQVTRQLLMTPDSSPKKVRGVVDGILTAKARPEDLSLHLDLDLMQAAMGSIPLREVRNIWAPLMTSFFPNTNASHQRNVTKVVGIVDALTVLHHEQRPTQTIGDRSFVMSTIEDNIIGLILADKVMRASLSGVPDDTWTVFLHMADLEDTGKALTEDTVLQYLHLHSVQMSRKALREKHIDTLMESGLLEVARRGGGRGGQRKAFRTVRTQQHLMEQHALTPLFLDAVRDQLETTLTEFMDIIELSDPPISPRQPTRSERDLLDSLLGSAATPELKKVLGTLVLPQYTRRSNKHNVVWMMMDDTPSRKHLFGNRCAWLPGSKTMGATKEHEKRKAGIAAARNAIAVNTGSEALPDDLLETMATGHLEALQAGPGTSDTGRRRKRKRTKKKEKGNTE